MFVKKKENPTNTSSFLLILVNNNKKRIVLNQNCVIQQKKILVFRFHRCIFIPQCTIAHVADSKRRRGKRRDVFWILIWERFPSLLPDDDTWNRKEIISGWEPKPYC